MIVRARADEVTFTTDDGHWRMRVDTTAGVFVFNIHGCAYELAGHADETLGAWRREEEDARASRPSPIDLDAYPIGDPKRYALEQEMSNQ